MYQFVLSLSCSIDCIPSQLGPLEEEFFPGVLLGLEQQVVRLAALPALPRNLGYHP